MRKTYSDFDARRHFTPEDDEIQESRSYLMEQWTDDQDEPVINEETRVATSASKLQSMAEDSELGIEVG